MEQTIIFANRGKKTTAELAILLLSRQWPQSLKSIHQSLAAAGKTVSMQATHKSLARLTKQNILLKEKRQYSLNPKWLKEISEFSSRAQKQQGRNQPFG